MPDTAAGVAAAGLRGPGAPLEGGIREQLSGAFDHDFAPVRVHVGPEAARSARDLGALAYTVGNDVVFGQGAYDPLSSRGRALIAHELAHVAQHGGQAHAPNFLLANPKTPLPAADARMERQAEVAAAASTQGLPAGWAWERASMPFLGLASVAWTEPKAPYKIPYGTGERTIAREQWSDDFRSVRIDMGAFMLPTAKGPWKGHYDAIAKAGGLQAITSVNKGVIRAALWEKRAPTTELRGLWLLRVKWPRAKAAMWWEEAGGEPSSDGAFSPSAAGQPAQIDHIVELQLGGSNVPENLAPHSKADNEESGRAIWQDLRASASAAARLLEPRHPTPLNEVALYFSKAEQANDYPDTSPLAALPAAEEKRPEVIKGRKGKAANALQVHFTAMADLEAGTRPSAADQAEAETARAALSPYPLLAGPATATLRVSAKPSSEPELIENSEVPDNDAARELIPGLVLGNLVRPDGSGKADMVTGWLNSPLHPVRAGTRLPLTIKDAVAQEVPFKVVDAGTVGRLALNKDHKDLSFTYPYLSKGSLTLRTTETDGLVGKGTITPSIPLLKDVVVSVELDSKGFRGSAKPDATKLSFPPFKVTDAALNIELAPSLSAVGYVDFALGTLVSGRVEAGVDGDGLYADGKVVGNIPGLDGASGTVTYRPATGLRGSFVARASRTDGLVRSGQVQVDFVGDDWTVTGEIGLVLPGGSPAILTVQRKDGRVVYSGHTLLDVPGLHPVDVALTYDGEKVTGTGKTPFTLLGSVGTLAIGYTDGKFTGDGSFTVKRGKFIGTLAAHVDELGQLTGKGTGSFEIRPGLIGKVGIEYPLNHVLRVTGEVKFPTYTFMNARSARYQLFQKNLPDIPLFAIPLGFLGSIGLVATLGGGLAATYSYGPGEIRGMVIKAGINPLAVDGDTDAQISAEATLVIPAQAGIELSVRAGIGLSVAIARVTGGITATGGVLLKGGLDAKAMLVYAKGVLAFDTAAKISVQPVLTLRLEADIVAEAGKTWRWPYELASFTYNPGLEFGMIVPFHYQSDKPLQLPAAADIKWIVPNIDVGTLVSTLSGRVAKGLGF